MNTFKVLAIDGGGIKGLYSATILSLIEADLRRTNPEARIADYADLICGTSTGGLIALSLALRKPADEICTFYEAKGPQIFAGSQGVLALFRQTFYGGKFSDRHLKEALKEYFGDSTIGDSHCLLCIPTFDYTHGTYGVFKFDHREGDLNRHNTLPMIDVALATAAAPTFFPLAEITQEHGTQYVDGGVWANNPSLVGLTEALWHFVGPGKAYEHLAILSVASLNFNTGKRPLLKRNRSFMRWAPDLFDLSLIAQSEFTDEFLKMMERGGMIPLTYTRIPSAQVSNEQSELIGLDVATKESFALTKQLAVDMYHQYRKQASVQAFFANTKTYYVKQSPQSERKVIE